MKKIALILAMLLFITSMAFGAHIEIGDGTSNTGYNPCYGLYNYSWSQTIYLQSEINAAIDINGISYNVSNTPSSYEMVNQKIFIGHTADALFSDNVLIDTTGLTKVYEGSVVWDGSGWNRVNFDTPFSYNNTDNLVIVWVNYDGDYVSGYPRFYYTNQTDRMVYEYDDYTMPIPGATGTLKYYVSNIRLHYPYAGPEIYLSANSYDFGMIEAGTSALWDVTVYNTGTENLVITGTTVDAPFSCDYSGTILPGGNDVATINFDPTEANAFVDTLTFVVDGGFAGDNTIELSGAAYPAGHVFQGFEDTEFPPTVWAMTSGWSRYTSASHVYAGNASAKVSGDNTSWLFTPKLTVNTGNQISFYYQGESASNPSGLKVRLAPGTATQTDTLAYTATLLDFDVTSTEWNDTTYTFDATYNGQEVFLAFQRSWQTSTYWYAWIDNVLHPAIVPYSIIELSETSHDFGSILTGSSASLDVGIKNAGIGDLTISGISGLDAPFSCDYTGGVLAPDDSVTISILFDGSVPGVYADTLVIESDADYGEGTVALSGAVYDPFTELSEDFEGCTAPDLPLGWSRIVQSTSTYPYVNTYSSATYAHSGVMSVKMYNSSDLEAELLLITPALITSANGNRVMFWARSSYGTQNLPVGIITDPTDPVTFTALDTVEVTNTYTEYYFEYLAPTEDYIYLALKHGLDGSSDYYYIDDFVYEEIPPVPVMTLSDSTYDFGWVEEGATPSWDVSITNSGSVEIIISDVTINPPFSCVYPDTVLPGNTEVATIYLDASNPGIFDDVLTFNSNAIGGNTIDLSAIVYGSDYVIEGFEALEFPPFGWINDDGYWNRNSANAYSGDGFARCSWAHICDASLISPRLIIESGDFISFYWINANLYDGKSGEGGKVIDADTTFFEITDNLCNDNWETLAVLAPEEEMTEYDHVIILIPEDYVGDMSRVRWRHTTELSVESRGAGVDEVMLPPLYLPVNFYLDPIYQSDYDAVETTVEYSIDVHNIGVQPDRYFLSILNSRATRDVEDFEATDGGYVATADWDPVGDWEWTNTYNVGNYTGTHTPPPEAHSGTGLWGTVLYGDYTNAGGTNYMTKTFDFSGVTNASMSFYSWSDIFGSFDYGQVVVNDDILLTVETYNPTSWEFFELDLSAYDGMSNVEISFTLYTTTVVEYAGWYIDDVYTPVDGVGPAPPGWPATVSEDYLDINAGEVGTFSVFVDIPEDVLEDDVNVTTVNVESRDCPWIIHTADVKTTAHPKDPYEPNDNFADATPFAYGDVTEGAQIYYNPDYDDEDVDIYTFDGLEGDVVYTLFDVADTLSFDGAIVLLDADSTMLAYADSWAGGVSEALQYRLLNDGTFYLMLGEWSEVLEGPFKKTVLRTQTTTYYELSLDLIPSPDVLVEPPELTLGIIYNGKDTASDILYITNTGDEGAINLDWDIEIDIPGIDIFLDEGFDTFPPDGWTAEQNWAGYNSAYAGGTAPEARFYYSPSFTGISRLISPLINTEGYTSLPLKFKHFVNHYSTPYTLGVATTSDGGTTWNDVWTISPDANVGPETVSLNIENSDVGSETFQVCWYFDGYSFNINYWYVDDVYLATGEKWASADPESGSVPQGMTGTTTITCDDGAKALDEGVYYADIIVHNNALLYGVSDVTVPLRLNVLPAAGGLEGHVIFSTTGEPIDSVKVSAGNFVAYTDSNGFYQFDAIAQGLYNIKYERSGFLDHWEYDIMLGSWVVVLDVEMIFDGPPPTDLEAEGKPYCIDLTWHAPTTGGVTQVEYVLDDGSYENGWTGNPGYELWFGNLFPVDDTGELISFDLYTEFNAAAGTDQLEIDIFDSAHNLVGSSDPFVPIADTWTTISCPNVPFSGEFYALIHFDFELAQSNWIGYDENGPNANANLDWYTDGTIWQLFHVAAATVPGVFMLRATAMVQGELREITVGDVDYTPTVLPGDEIASIRNSFSSKSTNNPQNITLPDELDSYEITINRDELVLEGYNMYREDVSTTDPIAYISIDDPRYYRDEIVEVGIEYTYWVTAVYTVGESGPSNYASAIPEAPGGWEDDFVIDWHLTGWTLDPISPNNWAWSPGYAVLNWSPSTTNYDMSLISPPIVLPDDPINVYDLIVTMYLNNYSSSAGEVFEISLVYDGNDDVIWFFDDPTAHWGSSGGTDWVYTDLYQYAGETVQIKFRSYGGDTFNFNNWNVYNVFFGYAGIPPDYGALQGTVTDGWGNGIGGAELTVIGDLHPLGRYVVTTNDTGYYEIDPIIAQEYDLTCVAVGYTTYTAEIEVLPDETLIHDIIMGNPTIEVTPDFVTITLDPNTQGTEFLTISNDGNAPLGWYANIEEPDIDFTTNQFEGVTSNSWNAEVDPDQTGIYNPPTKDMWDVLFAYDVDTPSGLVGLVSAETDGSYLYTTKWAVGSNQIAKFDLEGNFIEIFSIPGVTCLRDLAYDGTYFYGSDVGNYIWQMDFDTQTLVNTIPCPVAVRSIAYDEDNDAFWVNDWSADLKLVDRSGNVLNTIYAPPSLYGTAYDNITPGGPYLWIFTGTTTGGGCQVEQYDLNTLALTGVIHSVSGDFPDTIAGGLFTSGDIVPGIWVLGGLAQGTPDILFGYELGPYSTWIMIEPSSGTVAPGGDSLVTVYFDATDLVVGTIKTADIHFFSIPDVGDPIIPATLIVGTPEYGDLDGTVTDAGTTNPIEDVLVTATSSGKQVYTDITDVNGYYLIEDMLTGLYDVTFEKDGYNIGLVEDAEILDDQTTTVNYIMTAPELTFTPISFVFDLEPGNVDTDTLYIENIGTGPVDFFIDIDYVTENRQTILCVDRDGSYSVDYTDDWPYFQAALDAGGYTYTYYEVVDISLDGPDLATMQAYEVIIWFSGEVWGYYGHDCMTDNDEINLGIYLAGGGTLFLSAHDYFWASYPSAGTFSAGQFPYDYLGMRSVVQDNWLIGTSQGGPPTGTIEGVAGSLAEGYTFDVQDIYSAKDGLYIDWLTDFVADGLFNVTSPTPEGICGIQYDADTFRTVFTTASFAAIIDPLVQADLIADIITYLTSGMPQWLTVAPMSGTIDPTTIAELILTVNTEGLENGDYDANIVVGTENPDIGETFIPVHLHVGPPAIGIGPEPIPTVTKLHSNFPNPFSHLTKISFSLKEKSHVNLSVYNMRGQLVATLIDNEMDPAIHEVTWDGNNAKGRLASGIYFYRLEAGKKTFIKKMLILR